MGVAAGYAFTCGMTQKRCIRGDGHLHIYPVHCWALALRSLLRNLGGEAEECVRIGLLTEAVDCHFFEQVWSRPENYSLPELQLVPGPEPDCLCINTPAGTAGYLLAGRQVVSRERLEVLALTTSAGWREDAPVAELLTGIRERGAVPVLAWSPGKWFGARGRVVARFLATQAPEAFLLGDTSLRPLGWPLPRLMRYGKRRGFRVLPGSDPLPCTGEETLPGSYGFVAEAEFDPRHPVASVRRLLLDPSVALRPAGRRSGMGQFLRRWTRARYRRGTYGR